MTFREWLVQVKRNYSNDHVLATYTGQPLPDVCAKYEISRQAVHQAIEADRLDGIAIIDKRGNVAMTLVTDASLARYEARQQQFSLALSQ